MSIEVDWDRYADQYDAITMKGSNPAYLALVKKVTDSFRNFQVRPDSLIADLGGGTGNFTIPIAQMYPESRIVLVDSSEGMLNQAREKVYRYGLKNVDVIRADISSDIPEIAKKYSRPFTHVMMIHALYTTGGKNSNLPKKILSDISSNIDDGVNSRFLISDIDSLLRTGNWIPYCLFHAFKTFGLKEALAFLKRNDQAKLANRFIDLKQEEGQYLLCNLDEFIKLMNSAGFLKVYEKSDKYYRGRDNFVIASK